MTETQIRNCAVGLVERIIEDGALPRLSADERSILIVALKELSRKLATPCNGDDEPTTENPI